MIINTQRQPEFSLYYLGGLFINVLKQERIITVDELIERIQQQLDNPIYIDFMYYSLDWLYLLGLVRLEEEFNY